MAQDTNRGNVAYILMGGNVGDVVSTFQKAEQLIASHCGSIKNSSSLYRTAPWGNTDQQPFLNQVLELHTLMPAREVLGCLLKIETMLGRIRMEKYGPRKIDLDILFFNSQMIEESGLTIPHPEIQNRKFALIPLNEIAPDFIHPGFQLTISELLNRSQDTLDVRKIV